MAYRSFLSQLHCICNYRAHDAISRRSRSALGVRRLTVLSRSICQPSSKVVQSLSLFCIGLIGVEEVVPSAALSESFLAGVDGGFKLRVRMRRSATVSAPHKQPPASKAYLLSAKESSIHFLPTIKGRESCQFQFLSLRNHKTTVAYQYTSLSRNSIPKLDRNDAIFLFLLIPHFETRSVTARA